MGELHLKKGITETNKQKDHENDDQKCQALSRGHMREELKPVHGNGHVAVNCQPR